MNNSKLNTYSTFTFRTANSRPVLRSGRVAIRTINALAVFAALAAICLHASAQDDRSLQDKAPNASVDATAESKPLLTWSNGNVLPGELTKATQTSLFWNSNLFSDDLEVEFAALNHIRFPRHHSYRKTTENYFVQTTGGDKLYGNISKLDEDELHFHSARHGNLTIARDHLYKIAKVGYVLLEWTDIEDWGSLNDTKQHWRISDSGELKSSKQNINLLYQCELPDAVQIDLTIRWEKKLDFAFGLGGPTSIEALKQLPRIETWDDSLVLNLGDDFEVILDSLDATQQRLALQIQWDRKDNRIVIRGEKGQVLCPSTKIPDGINLIDSGFYLGNKKGDVTIETLQISKLSVGYDSSRTGVQTTNSTIQYGDLLSFDGENWTVGTAKDTNEEEKESKGPADAVEDRNVLAKTFRSAILNLHDSEASEDTNTLVRFQDGAILAGKFHSIADGKITLQTGFSDTPVTAELVGASFVGFSGASERENAINLTGKHRLGTRYGVLLGQVSAGSGKPEDVVRWQPTSCKTAVPLANGDAKIVLSDEKNTAAKESELSWPDTIYFKNKDVIPCRIVSIDDAQVVFESFAQKDRVSHDLVKAVEFFVDRSSRDVFFNDDDWNLASIVKQKIVGRNVAPVKINAPNVMSINANVQFGHSNLASQGTLKFNLEWKRGTKSAVGIRQFVDRPLTASGGTGAKIYLWKDSVFVRGIDEPVEDLLGTISTPNCRASIEIEVDESLLTVKVDGTVAFTTKINEKDILGDAVSVDFITAYARKSELAQVTISNISLTSSESISRPVVGPKKLEQLLTIPRLRKDNPQSHILCGRNIDGLRGKLLSLDNDKIKFESRFDDFTFNRDVISSIVWLHAKTPAQLEKEKKEQNGKTGEDGDEEVNGDEAKPETSGEDQVVQVLLKNKQRITVQARKWTDKTFVGFSNVLGNCSIPIADIQELRMGKEATDATDIPYANWIAKPARAPNFEDASEGGGSGSGKSSSLVGTRAKGFKIKLLDGSEFKLSEQRGKVVVLDFWATWCGPCVRAMPEIIKATDAFDADKVVFIAVNQQEEPSLIELFLKRKDWQMNVGLDNGDVAALFDVKGIPQSVIIDKDGKIAFLAVGAKADMKAKMSKAIQNALDEGASKEAAEPVVQDLPANPSDEKQ